MKCKECPANSEGTCLRKRKSRMLVSGSYGCDAQKKNVEKRLGIYKQTNADKIRHMTDEELAELIGSMIDHTDCDYKGCIVKQSGLCGFPHIGCDEAAFKWLKREVEE